MNSTEKNAIAQATMRLIDAWGALQALGIEPGTLPLPGLQESPKGDTDSMRHRMLQGASALVGDDLKLTLSALWARLGWSVKPGGEFERRAIFELVGEGYEIVEEAPTSYGGPRRTMRQRVLEAAESARPGFSVGDLMHEIGLTHTSGAAWQAVARILRKGGYTQDDDDSWNLA